MNLSKSKENEIASEESKGKGSWAAVTGSEESSNRDYVASGKKNNQTVPNDQLLKLVAQMNNYALNHVEFVNETNKNINEIEKKYDAFSKSTILEQSNFENKITSSMFSLYQSNLKEVSKYYETNS